MKTCKNKLMLLLLFATLLLTSCDVKLEDPSEEDISMLNESVLSLAPPDSVNYAIESTGARGDLWKAWDDAFFSCFQSETFKRKDKIYLGPSNPRYLGTILSRNLSTTKTELEYIIPPSDLSSFSTLGVPVNTCDLKKVKNLSLDVLLEAAFSKMDDSLRVAVSRYKNVTITGGEWQNDFLRTDEFLRYINSSTDPKVKGYRESLLNKKNVVIIEVIKIKGFAAEIETVDSIQGGLKIKLSQGVKVPVSSGAGTGSIDLSVTKASNKIVKVSSTSEFYIYGKAKKGKKL